MKHYEIWDIETGNRLGGYINTKEEADEILDSIKKMYGKSSPEYISLQIGEFDEN